MFRVVNPLAIINVTVRKRNFSPPVAISVLELANVPGAGHPGRSIMSLPEFSYAVQFAPLPGSTIHHAHNFEWQWQKLLICGNSA
jgi:hypothetical protein